MIETPKPLAWPDVQREALALVSASEREGALLRVLGSTGIRLRSSDAASVLDALDRPSKDIDLITRRRDRHVVRRVLEQRGYVVDRDMLVAMEGERFLFRHPTSGLELDLFVDRLAFCHTIELGDRLGIDPVTISLADLVLHKLQIVEMTVNDVRDLCALLTSHAIAVHGEAPDDIDGSYIGAVLAGDWGFHHTATANLEMVAQRLAGGDVLRDEAHRERALAAIAALRRDIDATPKSLKWRMRAKVGERVQWWEVVDESRETY